MRTAIILASCLLASIANAQNFTQRVKVNHSIPYDTEMTDIGTDGPGPFYESMRIARNGNVGIGTTNPQAKLAVEGSIVATEVKVKTDISVPDYVFDPDYNLPALDETEAYVKEYKHLPEIPPAADIEKEGLNLAEMNLLLLKKVEELTLHLIDLKKESEIQKATIIVMGKQLDSLTKHIQ